MPSLFKIFTSSTRFCFFLNPYVIVGFLYEWRKGALELQCSDEINFWFLVWANSSISFEAIKDVSRTWPGNFPVQGYEPGTGNAKSPQTANPIQGQAESQAP